jgi:hypothetical protein
MSVVGQSGCSEQLRVWGRAFPPVARDRVYQQCFEPLGQFAGESPCVDTDPSLAAALEGLAPVERASRPC